MTAASSQFGVCPAKGASPLEGGQALTQKWVVDASVVAKLMAPDAARWGERVRLLVSNDVWRWHLAPRRAPRRRPWAAWQQHAAASDQLNVYFAPDERGGALKGGKRHVAAGVEQAVNLRAAGFQHHGKARLAQGLLFHGFGQP